MIIPFLILFLTQFLSFEAIPLNIKDASSDLLSKYKTNDVGYDLYHKLDEAAQKALDLAEEAKSFAEEAGKLDV